MTSVPRQAGPAPGHCGPGPGKRDTLAATGRAPVLATSLDEDVRVLFVYYQRPRAELVAWARRGAGPSSRTASGRSDDIAISTPAPVISVSTGPAGEVR